MGRNGQEDMARVLTRREFLHRCGVVGGAGLVTSTLNAWELMGEPAGRRPALDGEPPPDARVLVLGAGIAGLVVGYELERLGYDYRILEARDRVGGVMWTVRRGTEETELGGERLSCDFDEGQYFNPGPWRIPHHHTGVLGYCRELGVPLEVFVNETEASYVYHEGEEVGGPLTGQPVRLREVKADLRGYVAELLAQGIAAEKLDVPLSKEDRERLLTHLASEGYLDPEALTYRGTNARGYVVPRGLHAGEVADPHELTALLRADLGRPLRSINSHNQQATMFQPVGGMDRIPAAFQDAIGHRVTLGAEVTSIRQTPDEVRVIYEERGSGEKHEVTAPYCIVTMPPPVLAELDHGLSPGLAEAVRRVEYSRSAKAGLQMRRRFWEEDHQIYGGHTHTNLLTGDISFPSNDFHSKKGVILGFYQGGAVARMLEGLPVDERLGYVIEQASKAHPQIREEYETGFYVSWPRVRYSRGGWGFFPGDEYQARLVEPDGRIHLATAGASRQPAWLEGAVASAWHTVENLHARVIGL